MNRSTEEDCLLGRVRSELRRLGRKLGDVEYVPCTLACRVSRVDGSEYHAGRRVLKNEYDEGSDGSFSLGNPEVEVELEGVTHVFGDGWLDGFNRATGADVGSVREWLARKGYEYLVEIPGAVGANGKASVTVYVLEIASPLDVLRAEMTRRRMGDDARFASIVRKANGSCAEFMA